MASTLTRYINGKGRHITGVKRKKSDLKYKLKIEKKRRKNGLPRNNNMIHSIERSLNLANSYLKDMHNDSEKRRRN